MNVDIFTKARDTAIAHGVRNVLVATNTGRLIEAAQRAMGPASGVTILTWLR